MRLLALSLLSTPPTQLLVSVTSAADHRPEPTLTGLELSLITRTLSSMVLAGGDTGQCLGVGIPALCCGV